MKLFDGNGKEINVSQNETGSAKALSTNTLPVLRIVCDTEYSALTKSTESTGFATMFGCGTDFEDIPITVKLQGSGSLSYDKHNLNISFYTDETRETKQKYQFKNWYETNKIHLKANEYDYSMVRNSVGTGITYSLMGKYLPTGVRGYIDSFPCILYYNGEYMGCHTFNLPQDSKTYGFDADKETAGKNLCFRHDTYENVWSNIGNWEYRGDEDVTAEMKAVFNMALSVMVNADNLTKEITEAHFDLETLLGYIVFAQMGLCVDSMVNNWTLVTWDGVIWYHTWYDLDICFGIGGGQDGKILAYDKDVFSSVQGGYNTFLRKVRDLYQTESAEMYAKWRDSGVNAETLYNTFHNFQMEWGWQNIKADRIKWADDKQGTSDIDKEWIANRIAWCDEYFGYTAT